MTRTRQPTKKEEKNRSQKGKRPRFIRAGKGAEFDSQGHGVTALEKGGKSWRKKREQCEIG